MLNVILASTTPSAQANVVFDYVLGAVLVSGLLGGVGWVRKVNKVLDTQDKALAIMVDAVQPLGQKSLKDVVAEHETRLSVLEERTREHK
jgi:hypothetical protein